MNNDRLNEIWTRLTAATPGPWTESDSRQDVSDLLAEVECLRAANTRLLAALDKVRSLAYAGAVCRPETCEECDLLREIVGLAQQAMESAESEAGNG